MLKALKGLQSEFPGGPAEYHEWFIRTLGILGDPVTGRRRIDAAKLTGERLADGGYGYSRAFTLTPDHDTVERIHRLAALRAPLQGAPVVLDPFAGGGSIPFEAARLGCKAIACELNPVAAAVLQGTVDIPARLGTDFVKILRRWGDEWARRVEKRLAPFYPKAQDDLSITAYIWAHTVPCPATGRPTPLAPDFWLATGKAGRDVAVRLTADATTGEIQSEIVEGPNARQWGEGGTYKQGAATSVWDKNVTFGGDYIREQAQSGALGEMLLAISANRAGSRGRFFRSPTHEDFQAVKAASLEVAKNLTSWEIADLIPSEAVPDGTKTREPLGMGLREWRQFFSPRQLLTAATALEEMRGVVAEARNEIGNDDARALNLYLGLALDKSIDYSSRLSSWHSSRSRIRNTFDRHDFSFKWTFAEFDGASALIPWAVDQVVGACGEIAALTRQAQSLTHSETFLSAEIHRASATDLPLAAKSVASIVCDPAYYDNVMYGELSDYFYVWLKRSLRTSWPELCDLALSDKQGEAVANPSLFKDIATTGRKKPGEKSASDLADEHYERLLTRSFRDAHRVLDDHGVMTVMFTHKRVDAWNALGQALLEAGFAIYSSWPVHTESEHSLHQAKKNAASSTIFLTCRKRGSTEPAYWDDIRREITETARSTAERLATNGLVGIDLTLATFGPVLGVLSQNWPVYTGELDEENEPKVIRPEVALDLAREEVGRLKKRGLLNGRDVDFDRVTDWYLLAWHDFGAAEFPAGEALKLSLATHLELDDLARSHKVIRAAAGMVTILTPAQRRTAGALNPDAASWPTMLDALHALMVLYHEDGLGASRSWLARTGMDNDQKFADLVRAALHAIPRIQINGEFVRPEARMLEGIRATLFDQIAAPDDASETGPSQGAFGFDT